LAARLLVVHLVSVARLLAARRATGHLVLAALRGSVARLPAAHPQEELRAMGRLVLAAPRASEARLPAVRHPGSAAHLPAVHSPVSAAHPLAALRASAARLPVAHPVADLRSVAPRASAALWEEPLLAALRASAAHPLAARPVSAARLPVVRPRGSVAHLPEAHLPVSAARPLAALRASEELR
jgi:hypothetical protein